MKKKGLAELPRGIPKNFKYEADILRKQSYENAVHDALDIIGDGISDEDFLKVVDELLPRFKSAGVEALKSIAHIPSNTISRKYLRALGELFLHPPHSSEE